jgi:tRNA-2-methylthio-N6-dimethylallyladenosine synthase
MNRSYTSAHYEQLVLSAREAVAGIAISTDIMVGFPTETRADHEATISVMQSAGFEAAFMFRYSVRSGTEAARLRDDVPAAEKTRRLREVIDLQNRLTDRAKQNLIGASVEVLIEGDSGREPGFAVGRTRKNWLAKLPRKGVRKGETITAKVTGVTRWMVTCEVTGRKTGA